MLHQQSGGERGVEWHTLRECTYRAVIVAGVAAVLPRDDLGTTHCCILADELDYNVHSPGTTDGASVTLNGYPMICTCCARNLAYKTTVGPFDGLHHQSNRTPQKKPRGKLERIGRTGLSKVIAPRRSGT